MSQIQQHLTDLNQVKFRIWRIPRLRIEHLWLTLPIALVIWRGFLHPLRLLDFWWHLKAGEIIFTSWSIPRTELFSFTAANGKVFVLQNWLAEALYWIVYRLGGFPLLVTLNAVLLLAALLPVYHLCRLATARPRLSAFAVSLAAIPLAFYGNMRPQVFSFVFLALFYWVLSRYCIRFSGPPRLISTPSRDRLWMLPLLMVFWVNLHGAFVLGLGLIALFLLCEAARRLVLGTELETLSVAQLQKLGLVLLLTFLATLVNPETYGVYEYVRTVMADPTSHSFVVEWHPPSIKETDGVAVFYGPFFITLLVLLYARRRPDFTDIALFLGFAVFALIAFRNGLWFVLIAAPIAARHLPALEGATVIESLRRFRSFDALADRWERRKEKRAVPRYRLNALFAYIILVITILLSPWIYPRLGIKRFGSSLLDPQTPIGAINYIAEHRLHGNIFHPQVYGDYLIWRLWPQQRSFVDGRVHVFGESVVRDYLLVSQDSHWEERLARYSVGLLLLKKDERDERMMIDGARASHNWRTLYEDNLSVLFEKVH